ncbi:aldo/keto reductase [Streptomyces chattanoogensis]|uniref:Aldo/keto reductase n=1 Tax=Streptomyces chattanoogensis TaxID=66876 RepID=A0A0N0XX79_9ACTN|nr:aldo/keto reductase [Streptomyces chattanoogensis]KPC64664.1 aldo/keto reductase [Streptomyces chattanoogensis]
MRYLSMGTSGLQVSAVGLGCNDLGRSVGLDQARTVISAALDSGITLFDTADVYGDSESVLGECLQGQREEVVLATKFGHQKLGMGYGPAAGAKGGRTYIRRAVEASLRRLRTDYIDLYQIHTPDPHTPIEETLTALTELVREGKVRYIGNSNFAGWQIAEAACTSRSRGLEPFISAQNRWSLLNRDIENEVVPAARRFGLGVLPYFPLSNGLLTGKVRRGKAIPEGTRIAESAYQVTEERLDTVEALIAWGMKNGRSLLEIAIGCLAALPGCSSVIAGAKQPGQVRANAAAGEWIPTAQELREVLELL